MDKNIYKQNNVIILYFYEICKAQLMIGWDRLGVS